MSFLSHVLADGCRLIFLPMMVLLTLVILGQGAGDSPKDFLNNVAFCLYMMPCILAACSVFTKRLYRQTMVMRWGRWKLAAMSYAMLVIRSIILTGILALFAFLAASGDGGEPAVYWLCLLGQVLLICAWFDLLQLLTKDTYAFLILFLCGVVEFANVFLPIGIQIRNPLVWSYGLFSKNTQTYGSDLWKTTVLIAGTCFVKGWLLIKKKDFLYG